MTEHSDIEQQTSNKLSVDHGSQLSCITGSYGQASIAIEFQVRLQEDLYDFTNFIIEKPNV